VHRVIVWGTGFVGRLTLKELIANPDYDVVGVIVNTPSKVGVDIGSLVGHDPIGVRATNDIGAALALDADVVAYFAQSMDRYPETIEDHLRALRAGKNVVSVSFVPFVATIATLPREIIEPFERACAEGNASLFMTGSDPAS
jgi:2,4-diaminopentanoate dehydrogenase